MAAAKKLGELLVQEGVISPHQLEEALKYQVIFGGKLGTNLIELDFVQEDDIAKTLSRMLRVPLVSGDELNEIPENTIKLIPRDIAEQYQAVPLNLEHRKLTLVMANPSDLKAIDEIAFRTGYIIRPAVAPEVRLILALEKYYHIPREIRYVQVSKKVESEISRGPDTVGRQTEITPDKAPDTAKAEAAQKQREAEAKQKAEAEAAKNKAAQEQAARQKAEAEAKAKAEKEKAEAEAKAKAEKEAAEAKQKEEAEKAAREKEEKKDEDLEPIRFDDEEDEDEDIQPQTGPAAIPEATPTEEDVVELLEADIVEEGGEDLAAYDIDDVFRTLAEPKHREDIADSVARHIGHDVDRAALFQIRGETVQGWKLVVGDKPQTDFAAFEVTLDHPSILKTVTDTASYYIGPIPSTSPDNMRLIETMGGNPPKTALLVPVIVMGRVVTVIYVDDQDGNLSEKLLDLQKLAAKMAMSFEILILKNKILMM